jgi:hypothetical protein
MENTGKPLNESCLLVDPTSVCDFGPSRRKRGGLDAVTSAPRPPDLPTPATLLPLLRVYHLTVAVTKVFQRGLGYGLVHWLRANDAHDTLAAPVVARPHHKAGNPLLPGFDFHAVPETRLGVHVQATAVRNVLDLPDG